MKKNNFSKNDESNFWEIGSISSPDSRFRVSLGPEVKNFLNDKGLQVDGFKLFISEEGEILLKPIANIPSSEVWIYKNPSRIGSLKQGIEDINSGKKSNQVKSKKELNDFLDSL